MKANFRYLALLGMWLLLTQSLAGQEFPEGGAEHWHHWRGPQATGFSPTANPPTQWDAQTNVRWKLEIPGRGSSSPIIWGQRLFLTTAIDTGRESGEPPQPDAEVAANPFQIRRPNNIFRYVVMCVDRMSGKPIWERSAIEAAPHEGHHQDNSFASASPTTDGKRIYVSFGSRGLFCYDMDGELLWKHSLNNVKTRLNFGEASSPVIHHDFLILNRDNDSRSEIVVLNAGDGTLRWRADRDEVSAWATPLVVSHGTRTQLITNASKRVRSYELQSGEILWECGGQVSNVTPSPVRFDNTVICMSGYRGSAAFAIPLDSAGDVTESPKLAWKYTRDTPYVPSPLLYENILYFNKSNNAVLTCLDAQTGKPNYEARRLPALMNIYASPVGAAERVYLVDRDGTTLVLKHGPTFEVLATNKLDDAIDASPALAGNQLYLRGRKYLFCIAD